MNASIVESLRRAVPGLLLKTAPADLEHYGRDWTRRWPPAPLAIALPDSVEQVQAVVRWANEQRVAIVPSGGRTGLSGGAVAANGELVVSVERMSRVLGFNAVDQTLTVQPGMVLQAVHDAVQEHGLAYPVDFGARGSCTIGGNIATNAGGIRVIRHGNTRDWIAGLKIVTGSGELLDLGRSLVKDASGYDLSQLVIGSEGTLGIVVEATLKLTDPAPPAQTMLLAVPSFDVLMDVFALFRSRLKLQAFEFLTDRGLHHVLEHGGTNPFDVVHPWYVLTEYDAVGEADEAAALAVFEHAAERGWVLDGVIAASHEQAGQLWRLREGITEATARWRPYKNDVSVRVAAMPAFLAEAQALLGEAYPDFDVVWFGHIGDGNLHINILQPEGLEDAEFMRRCAHVTELLASVLQRHGGSISAEHGVGLLKKAYLGSSRTDAEVALMRSIRSAFDPNGLMNPGKIFD
ncbi:FAD-binding oxidoreductase [Luteimonas qiangzhengi]|uniref:FAD-binding oxidoreductase n=1 Tax=Luteimonas sp. MJ146 TaxID=3129240 RepID=UPI0031BBC345